jgi:hypothetical protein
MAKKAEVEIKCDECGADIEDGKCVNVCEECGEHVNECEVCEACNPPTCEECGAEFEDGCCPNICGECERHMEDGHCEYCNDDYNYDNDRDGYATFYGVENADGTMEINRLINPEICFSSYNFEDDGGFGDRKVIVLIKKDYSPYNCERQSEFIFNSGKVREHVKLMAKAGFPMKVVDENDEEFRVELFESEHFNKSHMRISLDFLRLLWEKDINQVLVSYYKLSYREKHLFSYFETLQYLQAKAGCMSYGHPLPSSPYGDNCTIIPQKVVLEFLKDHPDHDSGSYSVWNSISSKDGVYNKRCKEMEKAFDFLKKCKSPNKKPADAVNLKKQLQLIEEGAI